MGTSMATLALFAGMQCAIASEKVTYYLTDAQGNVLATEDACDNTLAEYAYRPYGTQVKGVLRKGTSKNLPQSRSVSPTRPEDIA